MKTLITIILTALLAACGNGQIETTVKGDIEQTVIAIPQPAQIATPSIPEPSQTGCDLTTYIPCAPNPAPPVQTTACTPGTVGCEPPEGMELCDLWSFIPCQHPTWIPKRP